MPARLIIVAGCILAVMGTPGFAGMIVTANGAGSLPATAQDLTGIPAIDAITGTLDFPYGVDMFAIDILYPAEFSAYTVDTGAFGVPDPELFLFDANGLGVLQNDDVSPADTQSCLPAVLDSVNPCPATRDTALGPLTPGIYYLAITRSANSPLSNGGYIFSPLSSTDVVGPDPTSGGNDPITGWDNGVFTSPDFDLTQFEIVVQDVPEPGAGLLVALSLLAFAVVRLRKPLRGAR